MRDGLMTLSASNATVAEIPAERAKVGHTQIVADEMVTGDLISIGLTDVLDRTAIAAIRPSVYADDARRRRGVSGCCLRRPSQ